MATTKRISRKEIKQPDEFITLSERAIELAKAHVRELIIGIASLIVLGLLFWAWSVHSSKEEARASRLLAEAQALLHPAAPAGEAAPSGGAEAKSDPEAEGKALGLLQDLVEHYKRTKACEVADLLLGQRYYEGGNYDAAIDTYDAFLKKTRRKPELKAMAQEGLAYSYEAKGDFSNALTCYERLSRTSLPNLQGWAYLGMARCYEKLGEVQKATDAYRTLLADYPQHPKAQEARANIARLTQSSEPEGPGVKRPD